MTSEANASWRIQLFQSLRVQRGDLVVERFATRRAASLLAYLAFYPHRVHTREEISEMLWPEEDLEVTRLRLRQVLNTVRRALDSPDNAQHGLLQTDRTYIRINTEALSTDVGEFETLRKAAAQTEDITRRTDKLQQAIRLYKGELLPGNYEDWAQLERRRLQDAYRDTLLNLARAQGELGETNAALECARRITAADALDEEANATLIQLYAQAGRPAEALRQYQSLEQALWKELRALPSEGLQALAAAVRAAQVPAVSPSATAQRTPAVLPAAPPSPIAASFTAPAFTTSAFSQEADEAARPVEQSGDDLLPSGHSLNQSLTPFFGRQQEIADLSAMLRPPAAFETAQTARISDEPLSPTRLVTLVGPGGSGKTRLAQEVARTLQPAYRHAAWFVSLVDVTEAARLLDRIVETLYPDDRSVQDSLECLTETFRRRPALLVLDNFEHLVNTGVAAVRALLERAPALRCLVTSRQALQLTGERKVDVLPLPTPEEGENWEQTRQSPSVRLFEDRARNVAGNFVVTSDNAKDIAALTRYLEGFPLALELAAGWMAVQSPGELLKRLDDRFGLLITQQQDTPARHRSLYATIEWSYSHLPADVQVFFSALSVFQGGWTLEAAEAVTEEPQTLLFLAQLQRHSLLFRETKEVSGRMRMLETLRDFTATRLETVHRNSLRRNHAHYFLAFAECAASRLIGPDQSHWLERLHAENGNFRAALQWCLEPEGNEANFSGENGIRAEDLAGGGNATTLEIANREKTEIGLRFVAALWRYWDIRCHYEEAERWIDMLLARSLQADANIQARALEGAGSLALSRRHHDTAQEYLEHSVRWYAKCGDKHGMASALAVLAATLRDKGDPQSSGPLFEQSLAIMRQHKDTFGMARAMGGLGIVAALEEDMVCAHSLLEQSAAMYRICGHRKGLAWCLYERGLLAGRQGDMDTRLRLFQEGLPISRALNDNKNILFACFNIGAVYQMREAWAQAEAIGQDALRVAQNGGLTTWEILFMLWQGDLAYEQGNSGLGDTCYREGLLRSAQAQSASGLAAALERFACAALLQNDLESAVYLFSAAQRYADAESLEWPNAPRHLSDTVRRQLGNAYEDAGFISWRAKGQQMTLEEIVHHAMKFPGNDGN